MADHDITSPFDGPPTETDPFEAQRLRASLRSRLFDQPAPPTTIGRFEIRELLGEGGMGTVYLGYDPELDRKVAVKVLRTGVDPKAEQTQRLAREAKALAGLSHPNILTVLDVGTDHGRVFMAMEYVEGGTLSHWVRAHPPGEPGRIETLLDFAQQAASGLAAAHAAGIVHRDLKPHNMLIGEARRGGGARLRLADFGLARDRAGRADIDDSAENHDEVSDPTGASGRLTRTGQIVGTPAYMAPEQIDGHSDERSDQFSLCASLWEALYGVRPFEGTNVSELWLAMSEGRIREPPKRDEVPRAVRRVLERGLAADPSQRYPDVLALASALRRARSRRTRAIWLAAGVAVAAVLAWRAGASDGLVATDEDPCTGDAMAIEIWTPSRRAELRERFGSHVSAFTTFAPAVDAYAEQWVRHRTAACRAGLDGKIRDTRLDHRMRCLDQRRDALAALLEVVETADSPAEAQTAAMEGVHRLASPSECSDDEILAHVAPLPTEPWRRAMVEALEQERQRLAAHLLVDPLPTLRMWAEDLARRADVTEYAPLIAHCYLHAGVAWGLEDDAALAHLDRAIRMAERSGSYQVATDAAFGAAQVHAHRRQFDDARRLLRQGESYLPRVPTAVRSHVESFAVEIRGGMLQAEGKLEEAAALLEGELARLEGELGSTHHRVGVILRQLGQTEGRLGRIADATVHLQTALEILETAFGPDHSEVITVRTSLGRLAIERGDAAAALEHFEQMLAFSRAHYGERSRNTAMAINNVGHAYDLLGRSEAAREALRQSLDIMIEVLPPDDPMLVVQRSNLASMDLDDPSIAEPLLVEAIELARAHAGAKSPELGLALSTYGWMLVRAERYEAAEDILRESLEINETIGRRDRVARDEVSLAAALVERGRIGNARARAQHAVELATELYGPDNQRLAAPLVALGTVQLASGADDDAQRTLERALELTADDAQTLAHVDALFALARLHQRHGDEPRARDLAGRAQQLAGPSTRRRIDTWLTESAR